LTSHVLYTIGPKSRIILQQKHDRLSSIVVAKPSAIEVGDDDKTYLLCRARTITSRLKFGNTIDMLFISPTIRLNRRLADLEISSSVGARVPDAWLVMAFIHRLALPGSLLGMGGGVPAAAVTGCALCAGAMVASIFLKPARCWAATAVVLPST
jgi:hypothetical protein